MLELSCLASLRIELPRLLANDFRATAVVKHARSLSEQVLKTRRTSGRRDKLVPELIERIGLVALHSHCPGRAIGLHGANRRLLTAFGLDAVVLDSGCCEIAGSFGFKTKHAEVSDAIAREQWLLRIEAGIGERRLVLDGFICQVQAGQMARGSRAVVAARRAAMGRVGCKQ